MKNTIKRSPLLVTLAGFLVLSGCEKKEEKTSLPAWTVIEYRMTERAYRTPNIDEAITALENLTEILVQRSKADPNEYAIADAIWVNKMRVAGAVYESGRADQAFQLIDALARSRTSVTLDEAQLVKARREVMGWIANEYKVRHPVWATKVVTPLPETKQGQAEGVRP